MTSVDISRYARRCSSSIISQTGLSLARCYSITIIKRCTWRYARMSTRIFYSIKSDVIGSNGWSKCYAGCWQGPHIPQWRREVLLHNMLAFVAVGSHRMPYPMSGCVSSLFQLFPISWCCLADEFDVFMDAVNRRISMKMMVRLLGQVSGIGCTDACNPQIDTANTSDGKQYILITPQDMSNVQFGPSVRVHRMGDPERGQSTLNWRTAPTSDAAIPADLLSPASISTV